VNADAEQSMLRCLDYIRDHAPIYAKAKADRIYLEEFRKTKKALCMKAAEASGTSAVTAQEREAYADPEYIQILDGLRAAVEMEETERWRLIAAQTKIEVLRTIESSRRAEIKHL
jgi:hypothetical protein